MLYSLFIISLLLVETYSKVYGRTKLENMAPKMMYATFNNGFKYPMVGLGTWKSQPGVVTQAVKDAIDVGYRHIDCALVYGNEHEVGEAIKQKISEGVVKREDLFITGKLWNTFHRPDLVQKSVEESLKNLSVDYLDLYLIHWPMAYKEGDNLFPKDENEKTIYSDAKYTDTWSAMEKLVEKGLVKSIGLSNFNSQQIKDILSIAKIPPAVVQVECHPYLNQKKLKEFCEKKGITLEAYSPLGSPDRPWAATDDLVPVLKDEKVARISEKLGKSPAQILIRYQVQRGVIVIPKSVTKSRLISNLDVFDFQLDESDMAVLDSLGEKNCRYCHLSWNSQHKDYPFHAEF